MLPAMQTMADHGHTVLAFESAATVEKSQEILADWGGAGETAMWWQLAIDVPFLVVYALLLAGLCTAVARRALAVGRLRLARAAVLFAWLGPLAAASDLAQNVSLALVLSGQQTQPWPMISAVAARVTTSLAVISVLFAAIGFLLTRGAPAGEPALSGEAD
jgi:hypothetical protein